MRLAETLAHAVLTVRSTSLAMWILRGTLALCCVAAIALMGPLPTVWLAIVVILAVLSVIIPDSALVLAFCAVVLLTWVAHGSGQSSSSLAGLTAALAGVHWSAIACARGPVQARVGRRTVATRGWLLWALVSAGAALAVRGLGWLTRGGVPGGIVTVLAAGLAVVGATLVMLWIGRGREQ